MASVPIFSALVQLCDFTYSYWLIRLCSLNSIQIQEITILFEPLLYVDKIFDNVFSSLLIMKVYYMANLKHRAIRGKTQNKIKNYAKGLKRNTYHISTYYSLIATL